MRESTYSEIFLENPYFSDERCHAVKTRCGKESTNKSKLVAEINNPNLKWSV